MSVKNEYKVALVGCGGIAKRYRKTYAGIPGVCVVLAVDVDLAEAESAAQEIGATKASSSFAEALAGNVDVVVISTPNHLHREQAIAALGAGKHLLIQKPMARTVEECNAILDAARKSGKTLGVYMNLLEHPLFRDLQQMVRSGYFGKIGLVSARLAHRGGLAWTGSETNWRASQEETGGGSFMQLAVHYEHLIRWLLQDRVVRVEAFAKNLACSQLEGDDLALAHLQYAGGAYADLQTAWCVQEEHLSVMGTQGSIHYHDNQWLEYIGEGGPFQGQSIRLVGDGKREVIDPVLPPEWDDASNPFNQHRSFFEALRQGRPSEVPGEEGREGVRVVQACYESARKEQVFRL